jgi:hypothetical protein
LKERLVIALALVACAVSGFSVCLTVWFVLQVASEIGHLKEEIMLMANAIGAMGRRMDGVQETSGIKRNPRLVPRVPDA